MIENTNNNNTRILLHKTCILLYFIHGPPVFSILGSGPPDPAWTSTLPNTAWWLWKATGDVRVAQDNYGAVLRWVDFYTAEVGVGGLLQTAKWCDYLTMNIVYGGATKGPSSSPSSSPSWRRDQGPVRLRDVPGPPHAMYTCQLEDRPCFVLE